LGNFRAAEGGAGEMMEIRIVTAQEGLALLEEGWPTVAVSLVGDDLRFPLPSFGPHHLILRFHDVEEEVQGYIAPTESQLRQAMLHYCRLGRD
jgi:hypothetical protein